jgi:hypothetical protein
MIMLKECKPPKKIQKLQQLHWKQQRKQENQTKEGDEVEEVLNTMGIKKNRQEITRDRWEWRKIVWEGKVHNGM